MTIASACFISLKSSQLWMDEFSGQRTLRVCLSAWLSSWSTVGVNSVKGGKQTQSALRSDLWSQAAVKETLWGRKMVCFPAKWLHLRRDSRVSPLTEHGHLKWWRLRCQNLSSTCLATTESQYVVLWQNSILHASCIQYGPYHLYIVLAITIQNVKMFYTNRKLYITCLSQTATLESYR